MPAPLIKTGKCLRSVMSNEYLQRVNFRSPFFTLTAHKRDGKVGEKAGQMSATFVDLVPTMGWWSRKRISGLSPSVRNRFYSACCRWKKTFPITNLVLRNLSFCWHIFCHWTTQRPFTPQSSPKCSIRKKLNNKTSELRYRKPRLVKRLFNDMRKCLTLHDFSLCLQHRLEPYSCK